MKLNFDRRKATGPGKDWHKEMGKKKAGRVIKKGGGGGGGGGGGMGMGMDAEDGLAASLMGIPDRRLAYVYPKEEAANIQAYEKNRFVTIWPNYLDSKKKLDEGRRIGKEKACERPLVEEISEVCQYFKLWHIIEPYRMYPRDWSCTGRIRVRLKEDDGSPCNDKVPNKKELLLQASALIPKLASREKRLKEEEIRRQQAAQGSSSSGSSSKKKGKKKGKR